MGLRGQPVRTQKNERKGGEGGEEIKKKKKQGGV